MTRVCMIGRADVDLRAELLDRETAQRALQSYDVVSPWNNTVAVTTISLGAAVSLLNDLNWYLVRFAMDAMIKDESISDEEWVSRALGERIRRKEIAPSDTDRLLKIYGIEDGALVEPMYVQRIGETTPDYDLRTVDGTLRCRITEAEFG